MSTKFKGQRQWIGEILTKFGELEESQPESFESEPDWPEWVDNLWLILMGISYPGIKFKKRDKWKAKDLGKLLGRQYAGENLMMGKVPLSPQVIKEGEKFAVWAETWAKEKRPDYDWREFQRRNEVRERAWRQVFRKFIQETLASACERPYIEAAPFFEAFGKSIVMKPDELLSERTMGVGDKICWMMVMMWRDIERLESVAQLHRIFEQGLKPHGIVLKYKRIEKLCQRIKLKFREGGGRPKGSKNSDKSPRSLGVICRD